MTELELEKGKLHTLIGRNGIGKTTFFNTLCGLLPLKSGEISLEGSSFHSEKEIHKIIAFVSSRFDGIQHLSAYEYVALGRSPHTDFLGRLGTKDHERISAVFSDLKIEHLQAKETLRLSDGERQICSIARALVQDTPVILLDEPTAFLDYLNKLKILELLRDLAVKKALCIIQSSHDLDLSLQFSHELLVIQSEEKIMTNHLPNLLSREELIRLAFA